MIKLFIKYSYAFCKQDKELKIFSDEHGIFCGYLSSYYKINGDYFYILKFDFYNKNSYIWDHFNFDLRGLCNCNPKEINKLFKECQKAYPRYLGNNL